MVLEHLAARTRLVALAHGARPDATRDPPDDRVLRVHAVGEEERQVGREVVDAHAAREVVLDDGKTVGEREGQLRDGVRPGLGDVVAGDGYRVEVAHPLIDEVLLHVAHHAQRELGGENAGVLRLVLLEDVRLHGAAHRLQGVRADALVRLAFQQLIPADAQQRQPRAVVVARQRALVARRRHAACAVLGVQGCDLPLRLAPFAGGLQIALDLLVDGGIHEHRQNHRRRPIDGHGDRGRGGAQIEARVELLHVIERCDRDAGVAGAPVDIRAGIGVLPVQRGGIERGRQARRSVTCGKVVEAPVGALRCALTGEHARRVLFFAPVGIHPAGIGIGARQILREDEAQHLAPVAEGGHGELRHRRARQALGIVLPLHHPVAHLV